MVGISKRVETELGMRASSSDPFEGLSHRERRTILNGEYLRLYARKIEGDDLSQTEESRLVELHTALHPML